MPWTNFGWEDDPSTDTPLDSEKLEEFGEHVHDAAAATAASAAGSALTTHTADTTAVHGIADTSVLATASSVAAAVAAHTGDTSDAHAASAITFTPTGTIAATTVQAAIAEVASEGGGGASTASDVAVSPAVGGDSTVQAVLTTHESRLDAAQSGHALEDEGTPLTATDTINFTGSGVTASVSGGKTIVNVPGGDGSLPAGVEGQLVGYDENGDPVAVDVDTAVTAADVPFVATGGIAATDVQAAIVESKTDSATALSDHTGDTTAAHAASAISYAGGTGMSATDVEGALDELATEKADQAVAINAQTGTTYTLVLGDASKLITVSNAATHTLTVPQNSSVAFPVGTVINVARIGAGAVNIAAGSGATVSSPGAVLGLRAQYSQATLIKTATNTWLLAGDIA